MMELLKENWLAWFGIVISIYLSINLPRFTHRKNVKGDQLYKVYLPLFVMIEPYLYKDPKDIPKDKYKEIETKLEQIINKQYEIINPEIIHFSRLLRREDNSTESNKEYYLYLCTLIDREFEKCRRALGYPVRNVYYRINNRQYKTKSSLILRFIWITLIHLITFLLILYPILALFNYLAYYLVD